MFNIQRFGTDDTITSAIELKLVYNFYDNDTRTTTLPNPRNDLTAAEINSASSVLLATQAFVGDKTGAAFTKIASAQKVETVRKKLDLT